LGEVKLKGIFGKEWPPRNTLTGGEKTNNSILFAYWHMGSIFTKRQPNCSKTEKLFGIAWESIPFFANGGMRET
jgi:hypothetical protein